LLFLLLSFPQSAVLSLFVGNAVPPLSMLLLFAVARAVLPFLVMLK
jgi:hypothetical protein